MWSERTALAVLAWGLATGLAAVAASGDEAAATRPADPIDYAGAAAHEPHYDNGALWSAEQRKAAFVEQEWPKARLLVWATPGKTVRSRAFADPENWLEDGKPATEPIDGNTDLVFPDADQEYRVSPSRERVLVPVRHLTIGRNAKMALEPGGFDVYGNIWIRRGGSIRGFRFLKGTTHTFVRSDNPASLYLSLHLHVRKPPEASVEFLGNFETGDDFNMNSGTTIIGPDSRFCPGDRSIQGIYPDARLVLMSGARFHKRGNQHYGNDVVVAGAILAGTPERPLTRDCFLGLSYKDKAARFPDPGHKRFPPGKPEHRGLVVLKEGQLAVHSADPARARLVVGWHGREIVSRSRTIKQADWMAAAQEIPHRIDLVLLGDVQLKGVVFRDLHDGGIQMADPEMHLEWKHVTFGTGNAAEPKGLYRKYTGTTEFKLRG